MKNLLTNLVSLLLLGAGVVSVQEVLADEDGNVRLFATLPDGVRLPEGIAANPANGDIYVGTFDGGNPNKLLRYSRHGKLLATREFGVTPLLGLEFDRAHQKVYIANAGD